MKLTRRWFLHLVSGSVVLSAMPRLAEAQAYPSRPVHLIVPFAAGGTADILARILSQWLSARLGQPVVVENRPGAGTNLATEMVVRAAPDGYTLLLFSSAAFTNATLYDKLNFNFIRDIAPVAGIANSPFVMVVNPSLPAKTVPEFLTYAHVNAGKVTMASSGAGSGTHVAGELFKVMAGIDMIHVPYRGDAPALTDLLGGQVQVYFSTLPPAIEYIRTGKLRALAVTTAARWPSLRDVPTLGEFVRGYEASLWNGLGAPSGTPREIVYMLHNEVSAALADAKIMAQLVDLGAEGYTGSLSEFRTLIVEETKKWAAVIRAANIKLG